MPMYAEHTHSQTTSSTDRVYSPDILPLLQALLADLADIDFAFEKSLEAIERSPADEALKRMMIERLQTQHQKQRAPYAQELAALQEQIAALFA
jgi:DNA-binding transcriptional MerR regulator